MVEVMNWAAQQKASKHKADNSPVAVHVSHRTTVVPMDHVENYLQHEFINEGKWAAGGQPIIIQLPADSKMADNRWLTTTLEKMRETRRRIGTLPTMIQTSEGEAIPVDVGLLDITVFFQMPLGLPPGLPSAKDQYEAAFQHNLRCFRAICVGALHDRMILAACMHVFHADGWPLLHFHNLIFGLQQEIRGDMNILLAPLDMNPTLKALSKTGPVSIIGRRHQAFSISPLTQPRWPEWVSPMAPEAAAASQFSGGTHAHHPNIQTLRAILELPEDQIDLAKAKLTIDHMIEPAIKVDACLHLLDSMTAEIIRGWRLHKAQSLHKLNALRTFLYHPGIWNGHTPVRYDYDSDPFRPPVRNKLLPYYLGERNGNCISMPLLFIILGQKLGIDVTASLAPRHIFVKYRDDMGNAFDLETTDAAGPTDAATLQLICPMTPDAIANGIYMRPLTKREIVAVMMETLMQFYEEQGLRELQVAVASLSLEYFPQYVSAMTFIGEAFYKQRKQLYLDVYSTPDTIPQDMRAHFLYLTDNHSGWFRRAEALGWRRWDEASTAAYLERLKRIRTLNARG
jgi:regulator of sirC expression with transglutaminase-like and TPR domain